MASLYKRSHMLQEIVAHKTNINCLSLGRRSGQVMVTGGDDNKVKLWAIGKESCFMSLRSHNTPIECVQFNNEEEVVVAGSRGGAIKVWDLEAAVLVRTLIGHKDSVKCVDFHPFRDYLCSGSTDYEIKFWDTRQKGCICTYSGHKGDITSIKFSPDGLWIASGSLDGSVKIWDIRMWRVLKEFTDHVGAVTNVTFHPQEYLLATGSLDRTINFFDLEQFTLVSSQKNVGAARCMVFNPSKGCLYAGIKDEMKIVGWEPNTLYDVEPTMWGCVNDLTMTANQLIGACINETKVSIHAIDLHQVWPTSNGIPKPFTPNQNTRRSFSKAEKPMGFKKTSSVISTTAVTPIESASGSDPEEDAAADITNMRDYKETFHGRSLVRTPPLLFYNNLNTSHQHHNNEAPSNGTSSLEDERNWNNSEPASLEERVNGGVPSKPVQNPQVSKPNKPKIPPKNAIQRQHSRDSNEKNNKNTNMLKHSASESNISKKSDPSLERRTKNNIRPKLTRMNRENSYTPRKNLNSISEPQVNHKVPNNASDFIPISNVPVGLDYDDYLPNMDDNFRSSYEEPMEMTEDEALREILQGHERTKTVLERRSRQLQSVLSNYHNGDMKAAVETAVRFNDLGLISDLLGIVNLNYTLWNLDICVLLLPHIEEMVQSNNECYIVRGCHALQLILQHFGSVIKSTIQTPTGSFGVDIPREERYMKCTKCHKYIMSIKSALNSLKSTTRRTRPTIKSIYTQICTMFD